MKQTLDKEAEGIPRTDGVSNAKGSENGTLKCPKEDLRAMPRLEIVRMLRQKHFLKTRALTSDALRPIVTDDDFMKVRESLARLGGPMQGSRRSKTHRAKYPCAKRELHEIIFRCSGKHRNLNERQANHSNDSGIGVITSRFYVNK